MALKNYFFVPEIILHSYSKKWPTTSVSWLRKETSAVYEMTFVVTSHI